MFRFVTLFVVGAFAAVVQAGQIEIVATKDSTLYEATSLTNVLANGAGTFLYSGTTGQQARGIRRTLLSFDLSEIPEGVDVTSASLSLTVSKGATGDATDYDLHRLLSDWGEGTSDASVFGQGQGIAATEGDATWFHTFNPGEEWSTPGGDFEESPSATASVGIEDSYAWSSDELIQDVQAWLTTPEENFGWIMIGDESVSRTARQFNSRTNLDVASRPTLSITWDDLISVVGDCNGDGVVDLNDLSCACSGGLDEVLTVLDLQTGDFDGDGLVGFTDFLQLSSQFDQPGDYSQGDINCDGHVGFEDFLGFSANFGKMSPRGGDTFGPGQAVASVPEPIGILTMLCGIAALGLLRRKR